MNGRKYLALVLFALWVCLLNHSSALPLTFGPPRGSTHLSSSHTSEPAHSTQGPPPSRLFTSPNHTDKNESKGTPGELTQPQERTNIDRKNESVIPKSVNDQINSNIAEITRSNSSQHGNPNIVVLKSSEGPLILKGENESNIYVLAHVLDMEKGLYYIPTNQSDNSTEGWVFWKIPHLYKLGNPASTAPHDATTPDSDSDSNHGFYVLILGLGCFVCGLMVMLILTLVILTKRFSSRTRPPSRSFNHPPVIEADPNAPKYGQRPEHLGYCENLDYYSIPYGSGVHRLRRFSSDDAIDVLRRRAEPPLPPHYCACQRCYYDDVIPTSADDDDVPLLDLNNEHNDLSNDTINLNDQLSYNTNEENYVSAFRDTRHGDEQLFMANGTGNELKQNSTERSNDVSHNAPRSTSTQCEDALGKTSRNVKDGTVYINRCDNGSHPFASNAWIELGAVEGRLLVENLQEHCCGSEALKPTAINTIDVISCGVDNLSGQSTRPEKSPDVIIPSTASQPLILNTVSLGSCDNLGEKNIEVSSLLDNETHPK